MIEKGKLILIPTVIAEGTHHKVIPLQVKSELVNIQHFLAENVRTARRYLSSLKVFDSIESLQFEVLDKDTAEIEIPELFAPVFEGKNLGVLSESGCPGVADPGAMAVRYAHQKKITVVPLVGPSSILMALMASGLNGQRFAFHGYLPIDSRVLIKAIQDLEKESRAKNQTQIFIETPYRNSTVLKHLLTVLKPETQLCIAQDLTGPEESVRCMSVRLWKKEKADIPKLPSTYLLLG